MVHSEFALDAIRACGCGSSTFLVAKPSAGPCKRLPGRPASVANAQIRKEWHHRLSVMAVIFSLGRVVRFGANSKREKRVSYISDCNARSSGLCIGSKFDRVGPAQRLWKRNDDFRRPSRTYDFQQTLHTRRSVTHRADPPCLSAARKQDVECRHLTRRRDF